MAGGGGIISSLWDLEESSPNENILFSINSLKIKNEEYKKVINGILEGKTPESMDYEKYMVEMEFGDKIITAQVLPPDITKVILNDVKDIARRIKENNVEIRRLLSKQVKNEKPVGLNTNEIAQISILIGAAPSHDEK
jgi:hypothetical protein